ncbi:MAG: YceI family protein [Gemmatimonadetes bacterium]|nr:YceI family protein [Gemmatimonadota bacterium]
MVMAAMLAISLIQVPDSAAQLRRAAAPRYTLAPEPTRVGFFARGSLGDFRATTSAARGWVAFADTVVFGNAEGMVEVELATLKTGIGLRDGDTRRALETERFPVASFAIGEIRRLASEDSSRHASLVGELTLHGETRPLSFDVTYSFSGDTLRVSGGTEVLLPEFGIRKPKRFLGILSVAERVRIEFDAAFVREEEKGMPPASP